MSENQKPTQLKEYPYAEAVATAKEYFAGDELAATVWVSKYALKDSFGHIYECSPEQMHWRIANEIARIENRYTNPMSAAEVFELLDHFRYGRPDDRYRQHAPNCIAVELLRDRSQEPR